MGFKNSEWVPLVMQMDGALGEAVESVVTTTSAVDLVLREQQWAPLWPAPLPENAQWHWDLFLEKATLEPARHRCLTMKHRGVLDGLIYLTFQPGRSRSGADLVYVEYVEAAPEAAPHRVRGVASRLIGSVSARLAEEAGASAVGLHSKDNLRLYKLYGKSLQMTDWGEQDTDDGRWRYFEGGAAWLSQWRTRT